MAKTDETTRQVNLRAVAALESALRGLDDADQAISLAWNPLVDLRRYTNAHDAALEEMRSARARVREVRQDVLRRLRAEGDGEG